MPQDIALYLPGIFLAYGAFLVAMASPGPNILSVMGTAMGVGRREGLSLASGIAVGSLTWGILTAVGLSAVLTTYAAALTVIKVLGGCYLLWLAYKAFKAARSEQSLTAKAMQAGHPLRYARRGYIIQMTNPKAALVWIAIIALGLAPDAPFWVAAAIVSGTFILSLGLHCLYAVAFSTPFMIRIYTRARRGIQATLGAFFTFAGLKMLSSVRS